MEGAWLWTQERNIKPVLAFSQLLNQHEQTIILALSPLQYNSPQLSLDTALNNVLGQILLHFLNFVKLINYEKSKVELYVQQLTVLSPPFPSKLLISIQNMNKIH